MLRRISFAGRQSQEGHTCVVVRGRRPSLLAVAYYEPVTATDRTWELTMIGVGETCIGRAAELSCSQHVEDDSSASASSGCSSFETSLCTENRS
jgi:hypothetical protein